MTRTHRCGFTAQVGHNALGTSTTLAADAKDANASTPERLFENETLRLLQTLRIDTTLGDWLISELAAWYDGTHGEDATRTERLQKRASELRAMMRASYEDKLLGNIDEDTWRAPTMTRGSATSTRSIRSSR